MQWMVVKCGKQKGKSRKPNAGDDCWINEGGKDKKDGRADADGDCKMVS